MEFELIDPWESIDKHKIVLTVTAQELKESNHRIEKSMEEYSRSVRAEEAIAEQTASETFLSF
jgi:hypothetical protein